MYNCEFLVRQSGSQMRWFISVIIGPNVFHNDFPFFTKAEADKKVAEIIRINNHES